MDILIAPDSFKGSISSIDAADALATGLCRASPSLRTRQCPIGDGGEGTLAALCLSGNFQERFVSFSNSFGESTQAMIGWQNDAQCAYLESATVMGLPMWLKRGVPLMKRSTADLGRLIGSVLLQKPKKIIIGLGGSASNDWGMGMAHALGVRFTDTEGHSIDDAFATRALYLDHIDLSNLDKRLKACEVEAWCDISSPLTGAHGAALEYAKQKGASAQESLLLEKTAFLLLEKTGRILNFKPIDGFGMAAAGGLGFGLAAFMGATLKSGFQNVMEALQFESLMESAQCVVTGEGRFDRQSIQGKVVGRVIDMAHSKKKSVILVCGSLDRKVPLPENVISAIALNEIAHSDEQAMAESKSLLINEVSQQVQQMYSNLASNT